MRRNYELSKKWTIESGLYHEPLNIDAYAPPCEDFKRMGASFTPAHLYNQYLTSTYRLHSRGILFS